MIKSISHVAFLFLLAGCPKQAPEAVPEVAEVAEELPAAEELPEEAVEAVEEAAEEAVEAVEEAAEEVAAPEEE